MEVFCAKNMGMLCFSRPIYGDETSKPVEIEFGLIKPEGDLWVEVFDNR